ncbi:MAG: protein translocase subunit SecF [Muricomes sp.]
MKKGTKAMKKGVGIISLIIAIILIALLGFVTVVGLGEKGSGAVKNMNLGLELNGGVSVTYQVKGDKLSKDDMRDTVARLQRRAKQYKAKTTIYRENKNRIRIEVSGENAREVAEKVIQPGALYFIREKSSEGSENYSLNDSGVYELGRSIEELKENGSIVLTAADISDAQVVSLEESSGNVNNTVRLSFTEEGTEKLRQVTKAAYEAQETMGIYYDGELISVPSVNAEIKGGEAQIAGKLTWKQADDLAASIRGGLAGLEMEELSVHSYGVQAGKDTIDTALKAGGLGLIVAFLFMCILLRIQGLAAGAALLINTGLNLILINTFNIALTLPGIVAILLGIGLAADANVTVFAGVREQRAQGKPVPEALKDGFQKAASNLFDRNIIVLIAAGALWVKGGDNVRGFAQILIVSIVVSLFTTLVVTRQLISSLYAIGFQNEKLYGRIKARRKPVRVFKNRKIFFIIPITLILVGFVIMGVNVAQGRKALGYSIELNGGTITTVNFHKNYSFEEIGQQAVPLIEKLTGKDSVNVKKVKNTNQVVFRTRVLTLDERKEISKAMADNFQVKEDEITSETISPAVSSEVKQDGTVAVLIFTACVLLYIWFRLRDIRFVICTLVTLLHNVLLVLAFDAFFRMPADSLFSACMLIIAGFSINASTVIFDRVRDEMKARKEGDRLPALVNRSIAGSVMRNLCTSLIMFIIFISLYILSTGFMKATALLMAVGIICVIYSAVYIAAPLWYQTRVKQRYAKE